ncbi:alpha/beta fold hydrolase [Niabella beijingensis]|uniref:alpha/beta fold hydrolase n=1 Tax=Niabella beijingensis TaxID=2872700 RepID=UPI001CBFC249|nr:alpha/beta hydrolase [Niabella beijingensis]MBZ4191899.1 alpha/beta hydrolase [Niabella beijingensis]
MKAITFNDAISGDEIRIAFFDYGQGQPVVLIHGWPLSMEMWEYQLAGIVDNGNRVIKYDRRGSGRSSKPWTGYDYDTLAADLNELLVQLDLRNAVLVGFSMGGGEVIRYLKNYGRSRVSSAVLVSTILPFLIQTADNPEGVRADVFDDMISKIKSDRIGFLDSFFKQFFGTALLDRTISKPLMEYYRDLAAHAPQHSTLACIKNFSGTDFRDELGTIDLPLLLVHGAEDLIVPREASADRLKQYFPDAGYAVYAGAPHGLFYTHRERLTRDLVNFINGIPYEEPDYEYLPPVVPPFLF